MHLPLTAVSVCVSHTWTQAASFCRTALFHLELGPFSAITDTTWYKMWVTGQWRWKWLVLRQVVGSRREQNNVELICRHHSDTLLKHFIFFAAPTFACSQGSYTVWRVMKVFVVPDHYPYSKIRHLMCECGSQNIQGCMRTDLSDLDVTLKHHEANVEMWSEYKCLYKTAYMCKKSFRLWAIGLICSAISAISDN